MSTRKCLTNPNVFCYIGGNHVVLKQRTDITDFVKKVYYVYFKVKLGYQDKWWSPHKVCRYCVEGLRFWMTGKKKRLSFAIPMMWREPTKHHNDCYFCLVNVFVPWTNNILNEPLVDPQKISLLPLHIKLGLMKQFVRALPQEGPCFKYLTKKLPSITQDKLKAGIFVWSSNPQIDEGQRF
jgi:hypothetical protein